MILQGIEGTPAASLAAMAGIPSCMSTGVDNQKYKLVSEETQARLSCSQIRQLGTQNYQRALAMVKVPPTGRIILTEIAATYSVSGDYYQAVNTLASKVALCKRTIQRWLRKLEGLGLIEIVRRVGTTNQIFPKTFEKLATFLNQPSPQTKLKQSSKASSTTDYIFDGKTYSFDQIQEYISNKSDRVGKSEGYVKKLWQHVENRTLDLSDSHQYMSNYDDTDDKQTAELLKKGQEKTKAVTDELAQHTQTALADGRPLTLLEKLARDAANKFKKGPLGKMGLTDLLAIKEAKRLQGKEA